MRAALAVIAIVLAIGACKPRSEAAVRIGELDGPVMAQFGRRVDAVMANPAVDHAIDGLLDAVGSDRALRAAGATLADKLSADPAVKAGVEAITAPLAESPVVTNRLQAMMAANPGMRPDELGEAFGREFEQAYASTLLGPIENGVRGLIEHIDDQAERAALEAQLFGMVGRSMNAYLADHTAAWTKRVVALNGGKTPSPDRAAELYVEHAWTEAHMIDAMVALCGDPGLRRELAAFLRDVLALPSIQVALVSATREVASDPAVQQAATGALLSALDPGTPAQVQTVVDGVFGAPAVRHGATAIAKAFLTDPAVVPLLDQALRRVWADQDSRATLEKAMNDW